MYLEQSDLMGNPFVGVFSATNNSCTIVPHGSDQRFQESVEHALGTEIIKATLYNSTLIGLFCCMNSSGLLLSDNVYKDEKALLSRHFERVGVVKGATAIGNLVVCNDHGAVASPLLSDSAIKIVEKALGVKATRMTVAGLDTSGSCVVATNKGFLANPNASEEDMNALEKAFGAEGDIGSVNYGNPFVKSGILANDRGAILGSTTTPFELGRIDEALFFNR